MNATNPSNVTPTSKRPEPSFEVIEDRFQPENLGQSDGEDSAPESESQASEVSASLQREIEKHNKKFIRELKRKTPSISTRSVDRNFTNFADATSQKLIKLTLKNLGVVNGVYQANNALKQRLNANSTAIETGEIESLLRKLSRISITGLLSESLDVPKRYREMILMAIIEKEFGVSKSPPPQKGIPVTKQDLKQLEQFLEGQRSKTQASDPSSKPYGSNFKKTPFRQHQNPFSPDNLPKKRRRTRE